MVPIIGTFSIVVEILIFNFAILPIGVEIINLNFAIPPIGVEIINLNFAGRHGTSEISEMKLLKF